MSCGGVTVRPLGHLQLHCPLKVHSHLSFIPALHGAGGEGDTADQCQDLLWGAVTSSWRRVRGTRSKVEGRGESGHGTVHARPGHLPAWLWLNFPPRGVGTWREGGLRTGLVWVRAGGRGESWFSPGHRVFRGRGQPGNMGSRPFAGMLGNVWSGVGGRCFCCSSVCCVFIHYTYTC